VAPVLDSAVAGDKQVTVGWQALADENVLGYSLYYDQGGKSQLVGDSDCVSGQCSYTDLNLNNGQEYCYKLTAFAATCESESSNILCATPLQPGQQKTAGVSTLETGKWVTTGKGKDKTTTFLLTADFLQGDEVVFRARITDESGQPIANATFELTVSTPESLIVTSAASDATGVATAAWVTQAPDRRGKGGTATGAYVATVSGLNAASYHWDGVAVQAGFNIAGQ